jgi:hypothetical protein
LINAIALPLPSNYNSTGRIPPLITGFSGLIRLWEIRFIGDCDVMRVKTYHSFKIAPRVLVRFDHVARIIANANQSVM